MTKPSNIPDWAFKAVFAAMLILSPFVIWGFTLLYGMSNDIAVIKDRADRIPGIEKKVSNHESRINLVEDKLNIRIINRRLYGTDK